MKPKETTYIIIAGAIIVLILAGAAFWFSMVGPKTVADTGTPSTGNAGFQPFGRTDTKGQSTTQTGADSTNSSSTEPSPNIATPSGPLPVLRLLSTTPVGGYGASTTARTTVVRWVDRGRGNIYEASYDGAAVTTLSNTVVPRIYESAWNRNLTGFVGSIYQDSDASWMAVYSQLAVQSTTSAANSSDPAQLTPFSLRGKKLPTDIIAYALSPRKDRLFMLANENGAGVGYVSNIDGTGVTRIFNTPLTQLTVSWPSDAVIAITTKGSASYNGFLYFVNPKSGAWTKILGPTRGLSATVSHDGKYILWSETKEGGGVATNLYSVAKKTAADAGISTLAEKCAWGNFYSTMVYCAVPTSFASGTYPDDWYTGKLGTADKIWQVDASSGNVKIVSSLIDKADRVIDGFNLDLDSKDSYLLFMNKNDLSLWSLDLVRAR